MSVVGYEAYCGETSVSDNSGCQERRGEGRARTPTLVVNEWSSMVTLGSMLTEKDPELT
jgi:hypothetical protein